MAEAKTLEKLRLAADAANKALAEAQAAEAAKPPMPHEEAHAIFSEALQAHAAAETDGERHAVASEALTKLEAGRVTGRGIDVLAQHVIDARGE